MRHERGFTLIELMVVIAILAILIAVAVPAFGHFLREQRLTSETNKLVTAMNRARNEAIATGTPTRICPSSNPSTTDPCSGSDYSNGWVVFSDADADGSIDTSGDDRLAHQWEGPDFAVRKFTGPNSLEFDNQGLKKGSGTDDFKIKASGCSGVQRKISVNAVGKIDTTDKPC